MSAAVQLIDQSGDVRLAGTLVGLSDETAAFVAAIATPASATAEDCANKLNAILVALKAAGLMAAS